MIITSVNIGEAKELIWNGKPVQTGIFKSSVPSIKLGSTDVEKDQVIDRRYHGGIDKACYIYSEDHYEYWKNLYPNLTFTPGMFGENITIKGLNEHHIMIGDIYRIGGATVQVTQPRQPCFKLCLVFDTPHVLKEFISTEFPGVYLRVLEGAVIKADDTMELVERMHNTVSLLEVWHLLYDKEIDQEELIHAIQTPFLADACKQSLQKRLK